jgi:Uma2 family endonuclease
MPTAAKLLSYEKWLELPENDETREECVNGVIEKMPPPQSGHAFLVENLADLLRSAVDQNVFWVMTSNFGLVIHKDPVTQRTPDIAVFERATMVVRDGYFHSAPVLAVEVLSPSGTAGRMRGVLADYASIGLPEVWAIDPDRRAITIHILESGVYRSTGLPHDGVTNPVRFPSVTIDFSAIWP